MLAATFAAGTTSYADSFRRLPLNVISVVDSVPSAEVVVGDAVHSGSARAYLWSEANGLTVVGTRGTSSHAKAVSADGRTVVGSYRKEGRTAGFVWRKSTGFLDVGGLGGSYAVVNDVSPTGVLIVGTAETTEGERHAFRAAFVQSEIRNLLDLGTLGGDESEALLVSADARTVIGRSRVANGEWHLFAWNAASGMTDLGSLGGDELVVEDASDDARIIVGHAQNRQGAFVPFVAALGGQVSRIRNVGNFQGSAEAVSGDGAFIFGQVSAGGVGPQQAFRSRLPGFSVLHLGGLAENRSSFVTSASDDGQVIGGRGQNRNGKADGFLRVQGMEQGKLTSVDRVLNKTFENDVLPTLHFIDVPCVSSDGHTLVAKATVKGSTESVFVHARIDAYPTTIDQRYLLTRPWNEQIATYVERAFTYAFELNRTYGPVGPVYYSYLYAGYARQYQALCAGLILDGIDDAGTVAQYLEYRAGGAACSYYNFYYAYYYIFLSTGGSAVYSDEAAANAYAAYYYQQADLDGLVGEE